MILHFLFPVVTCIAPVSSQNTSFPTGKINYGFNDTIKYTCNVGFKFPNGYEEAEANCNIDGTWTYQRNCMGKPHTI